jgi:aryl-alcohol dehydrogenase-like predicted oxidoreductase
MASMSYKLLGKSGLRVSELSLGTMTFGGDWGWGADKAESQKQFDYYAELGGNFLDTANLYTNGTSEKYVGEFVKADRDHFVVATKYTLTPAANMGDTRHRPNVSGNHRKSMVQSVEHSLERLGLDYIDVLYLHAWDYLTPVEEVMRALDDLVRMGKIMYIMVSDTPAYIVSQANTLADLRGWSRFLGVQVPYSLIERDIEREILPMAKHFEMTVTPWGILKAGILTGKFLKEGNEPTRVNRESLNLTKQQIATVKEVVKIAEKVGRSPSQVAINWVRQQQHRAQIIPILGARSLEQLKDNMAVLEWSLTEQQLDQLNKVSDIELGFPHTFLPNNRYVFGGADNAQHIENPRGTYPIVPKK